MPLGAVDTYMSMYEQQRMAVKQAATISRVYERAPQSVSVELLGSAGSTRANSASEQTLSIATSPKTYNKIDAV